MKNCAIINNSLMSKYGRMDAGFLLAVSRLKDSIEKIEKENSPEEILGFFAKQDTADLFPLKELLTGGTSRIPNRKDYINIIKRHPYVSLAVWNENVCEVISKVEDDISKLNQRVKNIGGGC